MHPGYDESTERLATIGVAPLPETLRAPPHPTHVPPKNQAQLPDALVVGLVVAENAEPQILIGRTTPSPPPIDFTHTPTICHNTPAPSAAKAELRAQPDTLRNNIMSLQFVINHISLASHIISPPSFPMHPVPADGTKNHPAKNPVTQKSPASRIRQVH
jgi:hypothetical protein